MKNGANFRDIESIKRMTDAGKSHKEIVAALRINGDTVQSFIDAHKKSGKKTKAKAPAVSEPVSGDPE